MKSQSFQISVSTHTHHNKGHDDQVASVTLFLFQAIFFTKMVWFAGGYL